MWQREHLWQLPISFLPSSSFPPPPCSTSNSYSFPTIFCIHVIETLNDCVASILIWFLEKRGNAEWSKEGRKEKARSFATNRLWLLSFRTHGLERMPWYHLGETTRIGAISRQ